MVFLPATTERIPQIIKNNVSVVAKLVTDNSFDRLSTAFIVDCFGAIQQSAASNVVNGQSHRQEVIRLQHLKAYGQRHVECREESVL